MRRTADSLNRRLLRGVLLVAAGASLLFGALFLGLYRQTLEQERADASLHLNRMLQATWENAKRCTSGQRNPYPVNMRSWSRSNVNQTDNCGALLRCQAHQKAYASLTIRGLFTVRAQWRQ
jgi:hypothetical protein